jgi:hypothetical protein
MTDPNRQLVRKSTLAEQGQEDELQNTTVEDRWNMMQLAVDAWAMRGENVAEQEFQRHVERLTRLGDE